MLLPSGMDGRRASGRVAATVRAAEEASQPQASEEPGLFSCHSCRESKRFCDKVQPCSR